MHPRKLLPLGAAVLLAVAALLAWRAASPTAPRGDAPPAPATLPGEPSAPVPAPASERAAPATPATAASEPARAAAPTPLEPSAPVAAGGPAAGGTPAAPSAQAAAAATEAPAMSKDDIRAAIREVLPGLRRCYEPVAARDAAEHKVVVRFTLVGQGSSGFFKDADILEESTLHDPLFLSCLLRELSQARFRAPWGTGEVTITYPFTLAPGARDAG